MVDLMGPQQVILVSSRAEIEEFGKKIINHYRTLEDFEEILFLDDQLGNFAKVPSDKLTDLVGTSIIIYQHDGLPRWSYKF